LAQVGHQFVRDPRQDAGHRRLRWRSTTW
jgi:hypothetical protein